MDFIILNNLKGSSYYPAIRRAAWEGVNFVIFSLMLSAILFGSGVSLCVLERC